MPIPQCEVDIVLALCLASGERLYLLREELCTPKLYLPKSSVEVPCVDELVKILLCEGGDVELGARTSKHIFVFAFEPLSLTLSLILCLALHHIVHIIYMLVLIVCAHTCVQPRELYIAPQLLFRRI